MKAIDRDILNIALPAIVSNITVPLLGLVDVTIVGHIGGASTIGAIAVGSMVFNVIYWIFGFLRMGTSGITAQAFGRHDTAGISGTLFRSLSVGFLTGVAFVCLQSLLWQCAVFLIRPTADIVTPASRYFDICIWGAPATLGLYSLTGWYIGMQDTKTPMVISIMQNVLNIACSLFFVFVLGKGIEGVAFGTLTAQYAGLFTALVMLRRYPRHVGAYRRADFLDMPALLRFFTVNRDIFLRTLFLVAVNLFFTSAGARQGAVILSVNTLLFQLFTLYSYVMDGFAYAGEALGGRHYGARDKAMFSLTVRRLFGWSLLLTAAYTILYYTGGTPFLNLLTDDAAVVAAAHAYMPWAWAIPIAGMGAFYWDGLYIGMTASRGMLASTFCGAAVFFATWLLLQPSLANHALWLALLLYLVTRGIVQTLLFRRYALK